MPSGPTIANTSCLVALERIGRLDILQSVYGSVLIPTAVAQEWNSVPPAWIAVQTPTDQALVKSFAASIGPGESEAIALGIELTARRVILDDLAARALAIGLHVRITGTVGVVLRAKKLGIISTVRAILEALRASGFWISDAVFQAALRRAGE